MISLKFDKASIYGKMRSILACIFFLGLAYAVILVIYMANQSNASKIKPTDVPAVNQLNQEMLQVNDYQYLLDMKNRNISPDKSVLSAFARYFQMVIDLVPNQSDAYGMLGYCQYLLGKEEAAMDSYKKAISLSPSFSNYYYNLAVIFYNQGNYVSAIELARQSLAIPPQATIQYIIDSERVYRVIFIQMTGQDSLKADTYFDERRQKAMELVFLSAKRLENKTTSLDTSKASLELI